MGLVSRSGVIRCLFPPNYRNSLSPAPSTGFISVARRKSAESLDPYDCYLRGLTNSYKCMREANEDARAIELDPDFSTVGDWIPPPVF